MRLLGVAVHAGGGAGVLIAAIQTPLWFGKGGWLRVWELDRQLEYASATNERLRARNAALDAEVRDLKTGYDAIEERARSELGMIRQDEVFFQVIAAPGPNLTLRRRELSRRMARMSHKDRNGERIATVSTSRSIARLASFPVKP